MVKLSASQLNEILGWASRQRDAKGRSLLERARQSLLSGSYLKYNTTLEVSQREFLDDGTPVLNWDCTCPYAQKTGKPCKHVIANLILHHQSYLCEHSKEWRAWFEEFTSKQIEEALDAFAQF
ncbi:MAG: SWIM zinc finger family protein [Aquificae bacterium]|nr:SWIM zinc finger family protein [Aquificota bacterium]